MNKIRRYRGESMKVKWIAFENLRTGLKIEKIEFNKDITLLVGLSGVGKTQILNAVEYSLKLAVNKNIHLEPYHCKLCIEIGEDLYEWEYCIKDNKNNELLSVGEEKYYFSKERLAKNETELFLREEKEVWVIGYDKIPTPKRTESLLVQYAEDSEFRKIIQDIRKLYPIEMEVDVRLGLDKEQFNELKRKVNKIMEQDKAADMRRFSHLPVAIKLYIAKKYFPEVYLQIFGAVKELFIEIQDIDVVEDSLREMYLIAIRVYDKLLLQHEISNGMLKTIYYIVQVFTMPENSTVLIEEFENGLGVNCIDILSEMLIEERKDLQFIITSHHPKIINGIDKGKWKIIDRDASVIKNSDCNEYGIGNSQHDAYFNLINRWEFEGKV